MRAVLGIGNPGSEYEQTKHNVGFLILDEYVHKKKLNFIPSNEDYYYAGSESSASPFILIKPTTYVNLTGMAAVSIVDNFDIDIKDFLVISDDINLPKGEVRLRKSGGDGGHNGLASIIYHLNTDQFPRIRFGIGGDFEHGEMADYVLSKFSDEELKELKTSFNICIDLIDKFVNEGSKNMFEFYSQQKNKISNSPGNDPMEEK